MVEYSFGGMQDETKTENRMQNDTNLNVGMQQKVLCQECDLLILTGKMHDNFKIDEKQNITVYIHNITQRAVTLTRNRQDQDQPFDWSGMVGLSQK